MYGGISALDAPFRETAHLRGLVVSFQSNCTALCCLREVTVRSNVSAQEIQSPPASGNVTRTASCLMCPLVERVVTSRDGRLGARLKGGLGCAGRM